MARICSVLALTSTTAAATEILINGGRPLFAEAVPFVISGTADAAPGTAVTVSIPKITLGTTVTPDRRWHVTVNGPIANGVYPVTVKIGGTTVKEILRVQLRGTLPRQSPLPPEEVEFRAVGPSLSDTPEAMTDRWRIAPPPYELDENPRARAIGRRGATLDPYNKNLLKGDLPIRGNDLFFVLTVISDTLAETRTLPTPSGVSTVRPASFPFFGRDDQNVMLQSITVSGDLFEGDTAFQPVRRRLKGTLIGNLNTVRVEENAILKPDVRRGTERRNSYLALQELFYEHKLRDLSPNYDFVSVRAGSQPFSSDFRGFIFNDTNVGVRLFGNYASNRYQYNLAFFDRREKETNSGLNTLKERREQQVAVANFYWQDFIRKGFTQQFSIHYLRDAPSLKYDRNGFLVRPAPIGVFKRHKIDAVYLGAAGLGHFGRLNVDYAIYYVGGRDTINPIAGPDPALRGPDSVRIGAGMSAIELSYDRDWLRPRFALFYATGDRIPRDRDARGFDSIFDAPAFAGGGFSFFNRLGIRLTGTGVSLVERGSLLPSLRTSKDEGQPNFVNPGVQIASMGLDVDATPRLKTIFTANFIRLDTTKPIETLLFQGDIDPDLGIDLSAGARYRPFLNNNFAVVGGLAAFLPGDGFVDIYERDKVLFHLFTNVILTF
ncbi:MAG TPA: hypothetical protein VFL80_09030 [Thermoanaerobaculia bacterium]|nr:hypothetical protein [Thermoanaerobaculia bacterium]